MNSLHDPRVSAVIDRLHEQAALDGERWAERRREQALHPPVGPDPIVRMGALYMAVSREEGELLYLLARSLRATCVVEFGASYGVSAHYLGAAMRDTGGRLITTEVHPDKCAALRNNLAESGLADHVELLEGDARETLASVQGPVDMLVLDGWKGMYRPVLEQMLPSLREGALVVADNFAHEAAQDYAAWVQDPGSGFATQVLGQLALSVWLGRSRPE